MGSAMKIWKVVVEISHARSDGDPFCSVKCAFEYNDVCELKEEQK